MTETQDSTFFCGLDLSDKWCVFHILDEAGELVETGQFRATFEAVERWAASQTTLVIALETGPQSKWIGRTLREAGHNVYLAHARALQAISTNKNKSDQADAELLARLVRVDPSLLKPVTQALDRDHTSQGLLRGRDGMVRARTKLVNLVRSLVKEHRARIPKCDADSFHRYQASLPVETRGVLRPIMEAIGTLTEKIKECDAAIAKECRTKYPQASLLQSIPGIGPITALAFLVVIGDPHRFRNSRAVGAYLGLTPRRDQSGGHDPQLPITKAGDRYLRVLLVQAAHHVFRASSKDSALRRWGLLKAQGGKAAKRRAVIATARKLAVLMHRMLITGEVFNPWPDGEPEEDTPSTSHTGSACTRVAKKTPVGRATSLDRARAGLSPRTPQAMPPRQSLPQARTPAG